MDNIVFGPLTIPRYTMPPGCDPYDCPECKRCIKAGARYGWINDGSVCEPCADRLEAGHR